MQFSTKARYALRALVELSLHYGQGPYMLKEIARRQNISDKYLEQLMAPLRNRDIVQTLRGNRGGYMLSRSPEKITALEAVQAVEGSLAPVPCVDKEEICKRSEICATRELWCKLNENMVEVLSNTTLEDLAQRQREKQQNSGGYPHYVI